MNTTRTTIDPDTTVGELVVQQPNRSRLFEQLGLDYCCGGRKPLRQACAEKGLDLDDVLRRLAEIPASPPRTSHEAAPRMSVQDLVNHIVSEHHEYLRREMPRLHQMVLKVARVHGPEDARLARLPEIFENLKVELESHMAKEEQVLFPALSEWAAQGRIPQGDTSTLQAPIRVMVMEHEEAARLLEEMKRLTDGFTPPDWACNTYRAMLDGLRELEADLHQHVHEENNILFPRALTGAQQA